MSKIVGSLKNIKERIAALGGLAQSESLHPNVLTVEGILETDPSGNVQSIENTIADNLRT
jgi:replication fork clamp-binding protein CrfC